MQERGWSFSCLFLEGSQHFPHNAFRLLQRKGTDLPQVSRYLPTASRDSEAKARDPRHVLRHETHPAVSAANSVPFRMDTGVRDARLQAGQNEQKHTIPSDTCMDTQEALDVTYINKKPFLAERLSMLLD